MNRKELIKQIAGEFSESNALEWATHITEFYRSPGASGYHRATDYSAQLLRSTHMDKVWVERFPLDGETKYLNQLMPMAWDPISAELRVGSPEGKLMVSYENAYSCLPWWSQPTPEGGVTLNLIDVGTGERPEDYQKQDVKGKVVLIRSTTRPTGFAHAANLAMEAGVAGLITDYLLYQTAPFRTRESLPDAVQLLRMPSQQYNSCWAIVVDYPAAEHLASQCKAGPTQVYANIKCRNFKGEAQNLLADIEGTDKKDEFIQFVCHSSSGSRPGANCASGPAILAEMGRTMSALIERGAIPRPRRSIRFLINVEGHGSKHYITNHREDLDKTVAVFVLDSVGHDQRKSYSALLFYHSPDSLPSFVNDFYVSLMETTPKETRWVFHDEKSIPFVNFIDMPYTPWSDNKYFPVFGVPSTLLMSWPDLNFHTQLLSADNLDPQVFRRGGITTALAALELAYAGPAEAEDIMREVANRSQYRLTRTALDARGTDEEERQRRRLAIMAKRDQGAVASALTLTTAEERSQNPGLEATSQRLQKEIGDRLTEVSGWLKEEAVEEFAPGNVVPKRLVERDPPGLAGTGYWDLYQMAEEMHARDPKMIYDSLRIVADEMWNFADGVCSVNEIAAAIGSEFNFDLEARHVLKIYQGLESRGFIGL